MMAELSLVAKATVVLAAALAATLMCRRARASVRALLLSSALVAVVTLPVTIALVPRQTISVPVSYVTGIAPLFEPAVAVVETAAAAVDRVRPSPAERGLPTAAMVRLLWSGGTAFFAANLAIAFWRLRRTRRTGRAWPAGELAVARVAAEVGRRGPVRLFLHDALAAPMTYGIVRPVIGFPAAASGWDDADLRRALVHELEHVRRLDWLMLLVGRAACAMYWFHPLVWIVSRRFCLEAERACDDVVLRVAERTAYADQLVALARQLSEPRAAAMLSMAGRSHLSTRVRAVLDEHQARGRAGLIPAALIVLAAAGLGGAIAPLRAVEGQMPTDPLLPPVSSEPSHEIINLPRFDVASIRRNTSGSDATLFGFQRGGRFLARNVTVRQLIIGAYDGEYQGPGRMVRWPEWADVEHYDIEAKADGQNLFGGLGRLMVRALLSDRFHLVAHLETREQPVYVLSLARADGRFGPRFRRAAPDVTCRDPGSGPPPPPTSGTRLPLCGVRVAQGAAVGEAATLGQVARILSAFPSVGRLVTDGTGLVGLFDFTIEWDPSALAAREPQEAPRDHGPSVFAALQEQLGLKLEPRRAPIDVLVIDRVERPTEN